MSKTLTLVSLLSLAAPVFSTPCAVFDAGMNLYAFGLNGKDWNAGTQDKWTSGSATDVTADGRPPFDGENTSCYLAQFFNAIYVLDGDKANPSNVHIYNVAAKSWSTQATTPGTFDPTSYNAILDHDTNVFYAVSKGELSFLRMENLVTANSTAIEWNDVGKTPFGDSYQPVMALAQNHIHFINVPGTPAGDANIFVIHFSWYQPDPQAYPAPDGKTFPASHGQTASFFKDSGVQQEFAFIPDDGSNTYVVNVENNSTTILAGPTTKDAKATYAAGITALVQLDSTGALSFLPYTPGDASANSAAKWSAVSNIAAVAPAGQSVSNPSGGASGTSGSSNTSGTKTGASGSSPSATSPAGASGDANGAESSTMSLALIALGSFGFIASLL